MVLLTVAQRVEFTEVQQGGYVSGSYLLQGFNPGQITSVVIGTGNDAVELGRKGPRFVVSSKSGYPAVNSKVNALIRACTDIRTVNHVTDDPSNHGDLEVTEEKARSVVKFFRADPNKGAQMVTGVLVGKSESQTNEVYVRLADSNSVYTVKKAPQIRELALDYIEKEIVNIEKDQVVRVTVSSPEGSYTLRVEDSNDAAITLDELPEGREIHDSNCSSVVSAFSYFSFSDLSKVSEMPELQFDRKYESELKNETVYAFEIATDDDKTYVKATAKYVGDRLVIDDPEKREETALRLAASEDAKAFAAQHAGWVYEVSEWKAKHLMRNLDDLLEEVPEPEEPETHDGPADANAPDSPVGPEQPS
jgi:hypothetical protein